MFPEIPKTSRQFEHLQAAALKRLQEKVPHDCPLIVKRILLAPRMGGFVVSVLNSLTEQSGRYQVVAAWIDGYVAAWRRQP